MEHKARGPSIVEGIIRKWFWKWLAIDRLWRQTELAMMGVDDIQQTYKDHLVQFHETDLGESFGGGETLGAVRTD